MAVASGATAWRRNRVATASAIAAAVQKATTARTVPAEAGSPSLARASPARMLNRPPAKTLNATK